MSKAVDPRKPRRASVRAAHGATPGAPFRGKAAVLQPQSLEVRQDPEQTVSDE